MLNKLRDIVLPKSKTEVVIGHIDGLTETEMEGVLAVADANSNDEFFIGSKDGADFDALRELTEKRILRFRISPYGSEVSVWLTKAAAQHPKLAHAQNFVMPTTEYVYTASYFVLGGGTYPIMHIETIRALPYENLYDLQKRLYGKLNEIQTDFGMAALHSLTIERNIEL